MQPGSRLRTAAGGNIASQNERSEQPTSVRQDTKVRVLILYMVHDARVIFHKDRIGIFLSMILRALAPRSLSQDATWPPRGWTPIQSIRTIIFWMVVRNNRIYRRQHPRAARRWSVACLARRPAQVLFGRLNPRSVSTFISLHED